MSRHWLLSLLCLSASLIFVQLSSANRALLVNESATRFLIQDQTIVSLEVGNTGNVADDEELPWYRVGYPIDPAAGTNPPLTAATGVISLSEISGRANQVRRQMKNQLGNSPSNRSVPTGTLSAELSSTLAV